MTEVLPAVEQLFKATIAVLLIVGWLGVAIALSGLAVLIYRVIRMVLRGG